MIKAARGLRHRLRRDRTSSSSQRTVAMSLLRPLVVLTVLGMSTQMASYLPSVSLASNHYNASGRSLKSTAGTVTRKAPPLRPNVVKSTENSLLVNRTLVIVLGDLRCGQAAWDTLYEQVLDHNSADLALFTQPPPQRAYHNASVLDRAMHVEMVPNYTDWADALDLVDGPAWRDRVSAYFTPSSHPSLLGGVAGYRASGAIVNMYKWFAAQRILERDWRAQYDRFVITRTDQYYDCPLDLASMDPMYLWIPEGEDYGGITDRFIIASADFVVKALDTISPFLHNPREYRWEFRQKFIVGSLKVNCEKYLLYVWKHLGFGPRIRRFERNFFTCMAAHDVSRWGKMREQVDNGVHLKYPLEYFATKETCDAPIASTTSFRLRKWYAQLYGTFF